MKPNSEFQITFSNHTVTFKECETCSVFILREMLGHTFQEVAKERIEDEVSIRPRWSILIIVQDGVKVVARHVGAQTSFMSKSSLV